MKDLNNVELVVENFDIELMTENSLAEISVDNVKLVESGKAVLYIPQDLTSEQAAQARDNIKAQGITDNNLETVSKDVVPAINELNQEIQALGDELQQYGKVDTVNGIAPDDNKNVTIDSSDIKIDKNNSESVSIKETIENIEGTLENVQENFENIDNNFNEVQEKFDELDQTIQVINEKNSEQDNSLVALDKKIDSISGVGGYLTAYDFGVDNLTQQEITDYALSQIPNITEPVEIFNGTRIKNAYNNHLWVLTNTPNTQPAIFEWVDNGLDTVMQATTTTLGVVKSSEADLKVKVETDGTMSVNNLETELGGKVDKVAGYSLTKNDLTDELKESYDIAVAETHTHSNKEILDEITAPYTVEEKEKVDKIIINGDGKKALMNDGTYKEAGKVDTVNGVTPDEFKNVIIKTDDISDIDQMNKWSTAEEKEKISKIVINGDGKKALLNNGEYGEVGTVDTVNNVLPDENKNITITANDIAYDEDNSVKDELDIKVNTADIINNLMSTDTNKPLSALQGKHLKDIIDTKNFGKAFNMISDMISDLNSASSTDYRTAFNLLIVALEVPDFWITEIMASSVAYTYTTDQALIDAVAIAPVQIGFYKISKLETAKVDLSNYATKSQLDSGLDLKFDKAGGTITGNTTFNAFMKIIGTAADRHLLTRGIGGTSTDGLTADDLYINYGTDFGAKFGKTGQSRLKPDGGANFAVRPTVGVEEVAFKTELNTQSFSKVYKAVTELTGITTSSTLAQVCDAMVDNSYLNVSTSGYEGLVPTGETDLNGQLEIIKVNDNRVRLAWSYQNASRQPIYFATYRNNGGFLGWKRMITDTEAQTISGLKTFEAPANIAGTEQTTTKFKTSNGGSLIIGKEGANSGTMLRFDQVDGTARLRFRASATPGAMVWAQPENNAQLLMDLADNNGVNKRIMFNATRIYHPVKIAAPLIQAETLTNGTYNYTLPAQNGELATTEYVDTKADKLGEGFSGNDLAADVDKFFRWGTLTFPTSGYVDFHATISVKEGIEGIVHSRTGGIFNLFFRSVNGVISTTNSNITFIANEDGLNASNYIATVDNNIVRFYYKKITQYGNQHFKILQSGVRGSLSNILVVEDNSTAEASAPTATITATSVVDTKATKLSIGQWHVPYRDIAGNGEPNASRLATMTSPLPQAILIRDAEGKATFVGGTSANQGIVKSQLDNGLMDLHNIKEERIAGNWSTTGYIKYQSGLIIQWGYFNSAQGNPYEFSLPISFSNACLCALATTRANGNTDTGAQQIKIVSFTTSKLKLTSWDNRGCYWIALGY